MAELEELKQRIRIVDYLKSKGHIIKKVGSNYGVSPCPLCNKGDNHFRINPSTNLYNSFNGCTTGGSIIDLIKQLENKTEVEAIKELYILAGEDYEQQKQEYLQGSKQLQPTTTPNENTIKNDTIPDEQKAKVKQYIDTNYTPEAEQQAIKVLSSRGIEREIISKYKIFIGKDMMNNNRIIIPILENGEYTAYIGRAIDNTNKYKYINSKGKMTAFNIDYIKQQPGKDKTIYICEGVFDALSLEQAGVKAIAINSVQQYNNTFISKVKSHIQTASQYTYILSLDNDAPGQENTKKIIKELAKLKITSKILTIPEQYKDVNEWGIASNKGEFNRAIKQNIKDIELQQEQLTEEEETKKIDYNNKTVASYIGSSFLTDITKTSKYRKKTTGFKELDKAINGVFPGLYVLGAISSLGKTTLLHQIADQMASTGEKVIYFSLEQSQFELVAKSISRNTFDIDPIEYKSNIEIMREETPSTLTIEAVKQYSTTAENIIIEEGNFKTSVDNIREYVKNYIDTTGNTPNVFIDYLQILSPTNDRLSDKQQVDRNVSELKRISRDFDIPIFVICSFNRTNYNEKVDFTSFKESGGIEYTADVVLGLQYKIITDKSDNDTISRDVINAEKSKGRREITLVGLKNRNGRPYFKINYTFIPRANYFEEVGEVEYR